MKSLLMMAGLVGLVFGVSRLVEGLRPDESAARPSPLHASAREVRDPDAVPLEQTDDAFYRAIRDRQAAEAERIRAETLAEGR